MRFTSTAALLASAAPSALAAVFSFPLQNGFPTYPDGNMDEAIATIQKNAGGALPNSPLPSEVSDVTAATFQVLAVNEQLEVAFFTQLIKNVTGNAPGYTLPSQGRQFAINSLARIRAQEELHATAANALLMNIGMDPIQPCQYQFPVASYKQAIALAATFTDVVISTFQGIMTDFIANGDDALIPILASILGQEAEQVGYFRVVNGKGPSENPFLTGSVGLFAYSAVAPFIVPGSCPNAPDVTPLPGLTILNKPMAADGTLQFQVEGEIPDGASLTYLSGQQLPINVPIQNAMPSGGVTTFSASFPFRSMSMSEGLSLAAVTTSEGPFTSPADVAAVAAFGPGLINVY